MSQHQDARYTSMLLAAMTDGSVGDPRDFPLYLQSQVQSMIKSWLTTISEGKVTPPRDFPAWLRAFIERECREELWTT